MVLAFATAIVVLVLFIGLNSDWNIGKAIKFFSEANYSKEVREPEPIPRTEDFGFKKYSGNPILSPEKSSWEEIIVVNPQILKKLDGTPFTDEKGYWMYYTGGQFDNGIVSLDQIGLAFSQDLYNWTKYENNPVLAVSTTQGEYDFADVQTGTVLFDGKNWMLWYSSNQTRYPNGDNVTISFADSNDGINWKKYSENPILVQGQRGDDSGDLYAPVVIKDGNTWKMWYAGHVNTGSIKLMHATALKPEGPWTKYSEENVFSLEYNFMPYQIWKENELYYMTLINYDPPNPYQIRLAVSADGINWKEQGIILFKGKTGEWDDISVLGHSQVFVGGKWFTYYTGWTTKGGYMHIGLATSKERIPFVVPEECSYPDNENNLITYFFDGDEDGFGTGNSIKFACASEKYLSLKTGDCDDRNPEINPKAIEVCGNEIDDNCNGKIDEEEIACTCEGNRGTCFAYSHNYPCGGNANAYEIKIGPEYYCNGDQTCCKPFERS